MQTDYKAMMAAASELVARADTVAEASAAVIASLNAQREHLARWATDMPQRFAELRAVIQREEDTFLLSIEAMSTEIAEAITLIEGRVETETPPASPPEGEVTTATEEETHAEN